MFLTLIITTNATHFCTIRQFSVNNYRVKMFFVIGDDSSKDIARVSTEKRRLYSLHVEVGSAIGIRRKSMINSCLNLVTHTVTLSLAWP